MRALLIGCAALLATTVPALANGVVSASGHILNYVPGDFGGSGIPTIARGGQFAIACDGITSASDDVKVVMALSNAPGEADTGYAAVLATQQTVARHSVHVQVPDVPNLANHTVNVRVYVTGAKGIKACDIGRVRIV